MVTRRSVLNLGLIGFGRFGQFAAKHLRSRLHLFVWDIRDQRKNAASMGVTWGTLEEAAACQVVVLATPVSEIPAALGQVVPHLRPGALLMDVASVKMLPVQWMLAAAPAEVEVIGSHPLFGPVSGRGGIEGMTVVLCPGRGARTEMVQEFLERIGLRVAVTTPEEHDRQMAQVQALTHLVARGLHRAGFGEHDLKTPSYEKLLWVVRTLSQDAPEMFHDLHAYNPFAEKARSEFLDAIARIEEQLRQT